MNSVFSYFVRFMGHTFTYHQLRARKALLQLKDVPLRTRRALLLYKVNGNSALLALSWQYFLRFFSFLFLFGILIGCYITGLFFLNFSNLVWWVANSQITPENRMWSAIVMSSIGNLQWHTPTPISGWVRPPPPPTVSVRSSLYSGQKGTGLHVCVIWC